jgi:hypothetical protein
MRKLLFIAVLLNQATSYGSDVFHVGDINVKCNCNKDNKTWRIEQQIDPEWTKKLGISPPKINIPQSDLPIISQIN